MTNISRREFGKVFAVAAIGNAAPRQRGYDSWAEVQNQFTLEENLIVMNAANLCPGPASVNEVLFRYTRDRFSPHIYNDEQQVDRVVRAFHDAMRSV